ncbi:MAG: aspartate 1-decarboxylase [Sulfobacillus sp.]
MQREMLKSKIHRAIVTEANLDYVGSLTLGHTLAQAADILDSEFVHVTNINTGIHWVTYVIVDWEHSGTVCLNGTAARNFHPGDPVIIMAYGHYSPEEISQLTPRIVFVDDQNRIEKVLTKEPPRSTTGE